MLRLISLLAIPVLLGGYAATAGSQRRATPASLAEAESRACAGIPEDARNKGPFEHAERITSIDPFVVEEYPRTTPPIERVAGAVVTMRAEPGLTAEWLQRVVDCNLAHSASSGYSAAEMPNSPLGLEGVKAEVRSTGDGFAVEIQSKERKVSREILARAQQLPGQDRITAG
jgi:hypothetical protein